MFANCSTIRVRSRSLDSFQTRQCRVSRSSLPVIVNVSPNKASDRHLSPPSILRRSHETLNSNMSSLRNIHTTFFKELIRQCGTNTVSAVTQCVLDLSLIVSVHASLPELHRSMNDAEDDYRHKYLQLIDPLNYTVEIPDKTRSSSLEPEILALHQAIKQHGANIRNAQCKEYLPVRITSACFSNLAMRHLITSLCSKSVRSYRSTIRPFSLPFQNARPPNLLQATTFILPDSNAAHRTSRHRSLSIQRVNKRQATSIDPHLPITASKQQAHFTPIIELKPILSGPTALDDSRLEPTNRKLTKIITTNTVQKDLQRVNTIVSRASSLCHSFRFSLT